VSFCALSPRTCCLFTGLYLSRLYLSSLSAFLHIYILARLLNPNIYTHTHNHTPSYTISLSRCLANAHAIGTPPPCCVSLNRDAAVGSSFIALGGEKERGGDASLDPPSLLYAEAFGGLSLTTPVSLLSSSMWSSSLLSGDLSTGTDASTSSSGSTSSHGSTTSGTTEGVWLDHDEDTSGRAHYVRLANGYELGWLGWVVWCVFFVVVVCVCVYVCVCVCVCVCCSFWLVIVGIACCRLLVNVCVCVCFFFLSLCSPFSFYLWLCLFVYVCVYLSLFLSFFHSLLYFALCSFLHTIAYLCVFVFFFFNSEWSREIGTVARSKKAEEQSEYQNSKNRTVRRRAPQLYQYKYYIEQVCKQGRLYNSGVE
jgi:hypothetical protein